MRCGAPYFFFGAEAGIGVTWVAEAARGGRAEASVGAPPEGVAVGSYLKFHFVSSRLPLDLAEMNTVYSGSRSFCVIWKVTVFEAASYFTGTGPNPLMRISTLPVSISPRVERLALMSGLGSPMVSPSIGWVTIEAAANCV